MNMRFHFNFSLIILLVILLISLISCKSENIAIETSNIKSDTIKEKDYYSNVTAEIFKDSTFYFARFEALHIKNGQFKINDISYNVKDIKKVKLGIDNKEKWDQKIFPIKIFEFINLEYLWIGMRGFEEIPGEISKLKHLNHLDLQHGNVRKLPVEINQLAHLETLVLSWSNINELPIGFEKLKQLKFLYLGCTKLEEVPKELYQMTNLEHLILSHDDECQEKREVFSETENDKMKRSLKNTKVGIGRRKPANKQ